ncbi:unnamed protein product [Danaus chrysippus]|uniref:(African queen) hypothetical protein n=1 Tax=Danaus chrysippus TaxID=151541 RepID=A0A8J2QFP6_9NEOP|nr:unnamed protein product [Danaus chrysippus]
MSGRVPQETECGETRQKHSVTAWTIDSSPGNRMQIDCRNNEPRNWNKVSRSSWGWGACACTVGRARHMRNIKGGKRKKLTCEAIFVYWYPLARDGFSDAGRAPRGAVEDERLAVF